jgi:hypothetical protein
MAEWARITATTIADYAKGVEDELIAKRILLQALKKSGQIVMNKGGDGFKWQVQYRLPPATINNGEQTVTPSRQDIYKQATLDYVGYTLADMMTKREKLKNRGAPALVEHFSNMSKWLMESASQRLSEELYVDSSGSGNSGRLSGIETMMAINGTVTITSGAQRAANAADVAGYPNDTYAGLSTVLGNYAGSWGTQSGITSTWPAGTGDLSYDFYSPTIVNYTSSAFSGAADTWAEQCVEATRFLITHMNRYVSDRGQLKTVLLDRELYRQYLQKLDSKERINTSSSLGLRALGFEDTFMQDGVDVTWEFGIPAAVGYGFNVKQMELRSMQDKLFVTDGPTYEPLNRSYYVIVDYLGQIKFHSPRFFGKLANIA